MTALSSRRTDAEALSGNVHPAFARLDSRELAFAERMYRGVLQNLRLIDELIDAPRLIDRSRTSEKLIWLLRMAVYQRVWLRSTPDHAIGQQSVEHARRVGGEPAARFMNAVIRRLLAFLPADEEGLESRLGEGQKNAPSAARRWSVPDEIEALLAEGYDAEAAARILKAFNNDQTRVGLRVNVLKTSPETLAADLLDEGVETQIEAPGFLRWIPGSMPPWKSEAWRRGELTVQDPGAMTPVWILDPRPGETALDWCAAPGGKTGQMWECMEGRGRLIAWETDAARRGKLRESLARLYGQEYGIEIPDRPPDESRVQADAVLVDAPCLALGLLGRHPEARWDERTKSLKRICTMQTAIIEDAAACVAPEGRLVWATCSPTVEENEGVVETFLNRHPEFHRQAETFLSGLIEEAGMSDWVQFNRGVLRTRPDLAPVDGFAVTALCRS